MCKLRTFLFLQMICVACIQATSLVRVRRQGQKKCPDSPFFLPSFACNSGECIDGNQECDGKQDCQDGSDETEDCRKIKCISNQFACKYGACIEKRLECDGRVDCRDESDEEPDRCESKVAGRCELPNHPDFGRWVVQSEDQSPKKYVPPQTIIKIECNEGYLLEGSNVLFCNNGHWSSKVGRCLKTCPPRFSTNFMHIKCIFKNKEVENCTDAVDGTLSKPTCSPFFEDPALEINPIHICRNGVWNQPEPRCVPTCGRKSVDATELIIKGKNVTKGDYPWQVALYTVKDKILICGGSLLNRRIVLTAAHCVTNVKGKLDKKENYIVAVGKYFRSFDDNRDQKDAQFSELQEMFIPAEYRGDLQNYLGDIAILVTKKTFDYSRTVQPVCIDSGYHIKGNAQDGLVVGWGLTHENSLPAEVLKELQVPPVSTSTCQRNLDEDYEIYLTHDKLCAGFLEKGTSVCRGDSGGGLVFKHNSRYHVSGIVSLAPISPTNVDGCDSQQYGLYTNVSYYFNSFILPKLVEFST